MCPGESVRKRLSHELEGRSRPEWEREKGERTARFRRMTIPNWSFKPNGSYATMQLPGAVNVSQNQRRRFSVVSESR